MLVEQENLIEFLEADHETETNIVSVIQEGVESWVKSYCHHEFESTAYYEFYNGGGDYLYLDHYPVISINRISSGRRNAIIIKNTESGTYATVSVTSTGLVLVKDGVSNSTISFAAYTTMADIVSAINLIGSGWEAEIYHSDFNTYISTDLLKVYGKSTIDNNRVYLEIPEESIDDFEVDISTGELFRIGGWSKGYNNIYVEYTAGRSTIPEDIKLAVMIICRSIYQKRNEETFGVDNYGIGDIRIAHEKGEIPKEAMGILDRHRKVLV